MLSLRLLNPNRINRITINGWKNLFNTRIVWSTNDNRNESFISLKFDPKESRKFVENYQQILNNVSFWLKCVTENKQSVQQLLAQKEFVTLCEKIVNSLSSFDDKKIINLLNTFLIMGLDPNTRVILYLENEILWRSRNLSLKSLLKCLSYHIRYQETDQQKQIVNELILKIPTKLDEAKDDADVLLMLRLSKCFTNECIERIEKTALEMIVNDSGDQFKVDSLCYLLVLLSQLSRRTKPLIRAAINKLNNLRIEEMQSSPNNLINMISALNTLNFPDINLLDKSCNLLCDMKFLDEVPASSKRDLLVAVSQLNWCYPRLMDAFIEKMIEKPDSFSPQELLVFVITSARLYYRSPSVHEILSSHIIPNVKQKNTDSKSWLSYVWSLTILGNVPFEHISSVLNNEFCDELLNKSKDYEFDMIKLKLLNIKAFAEIEMKIDIDSPNCLKSDLKMPKKHKELQIYQNIIIESLNLFIPKDQCMATNIMTPLGFSIDAEFIVDSHNKCVPITKYGIFGAHLNSKTKSLSPGFQRVALMIYGYNDTLINTSQQIGVHEFAIRLLKLLNYSVVVINQNTIPIAMNSFDKTKHLQKLITNRKT